MLREVTKSVRGVEKPNLQSKRMYINANSETLSDMTKTEPAIKKNVH